LGGRVAADLISAEVDRRLYSLTGKTVFAVAGFVAAGLPLCMAVARALAPGSRQGYIAVMLQAFRRQPISWEFSDSNPRRRRIIKLRRLSQEFRRIAEEYGAVDHKLAERLREVIRELEEEAAALERTERGD
jgi:hypothetical protein